VALHTRIDHLVITAADLDEGVAWAESALGVPMGPGGVHETMGTHNRLLRLQDELYLEVIAPNPASTPPAHPRWFGLDALMPGSAPRLSAWVVRTDDIQAARAATALDLGPPVAKRRGPWHWQITVPANGRQPLDGLAPALIEWPAGQHPTSQMAASGVRLVGLTLHATEPDVARHALALWGLNDQVAVEAAWPGAEATLDAVFSTPSGPCRIACNHVQRP
jgi:hypothetical protein